MSGDLSAIVARLESVTSRLERLDQAGGGGAGGEGAAVSSESVEEFVSVICGSGSKLSEYLSLSQKLGGDIAEQAKLVDEVFKQMRAILVLASQHCRPTTSVLGGVFKLLEAKVIPVSEFPGKHRSSKAYNNLMTVSEGISCGGWVSVSPKPVPYLKEAENQALFYGNRVIKEFKGKNEDQVKWVRAYTGTIQALQVYVKQHHTTGLEWKKNGSVLSAASTAGPPPPPPPAVQPPSAVSASKSSDNSSQRANLLEDLNKGGNVTKGLKKVTNEMKTHKNQELRASSLVKAGDIKSASKPASKFGTSATTGVKKPPVLALQNKKWIVEFQEGKSDLTIAETNSKQTVYIYSCVKCTLKVSGKVNSIILDSCKRFALCFDDVISSVEMINSQGIQVQMMGKCPTVSIDKTDGCQIYLSKDSIKCEIISAKSSEMNVCIPPKVEGDDFIERPIPEQFKTVWNGSALVTESTDIAS